MGISLDIRNAMLNWFFSQESTSSYVRPTEFWLALIKTDNSEPEVNTSTGYERYYTTIDDWGLASNGVVINIIKFIMETPTGTWGNIDRVRVYDAEDDGNILADAYLPEARDVTAVVPAPEFQIGNIRWVLLSPQILISTYVRNHMLDWFFNHEDTQPWEPPTDFWIALVNTDDNEVDPETAGGYGRYHSTINDWSVASNGVVTNLNQFVMNTPTGSWGSIHKVRIYDAETGGNELGEATLDTTLLVTAVTPAPEFQIGSLIWSLGT